MKRYMKKPVIIEAERLTEEKQIETLEGTMKGNAGDWLIRGVEGELYPCKDEIFKKTYIPMHKILVKIVCFVPNFCDFCL